MVCPKRTRIFPLRICDSIAFADYNPSIFASGDTRALIRFFEPWNNARCFGLMAFACFIVVREGAIKRVLPWSKFCRYVMVTMSWIGVIKTAVALGPLFVPGTRAIWDQIMSGGLFANPEDGRYDTRFPRVVWRRSRYRRFSAAAFFFFRDFFDLSRGKRIKCNEERQTG